MSLNTRFTLLVRVTPFDLFFFSEPNDSIAINRKLTAGAQPDPLRRKHDEVMLFKGA
jgi:hypothetical protein